MTALDADAPAAVPEIRMEPETGVLDGNQQHPDPTPAQPAHGSSEPSNEARLAAMADSELVRYRIEYASQESGSVFFDGKITERDTSEEPRIFEYVDVRLSSNDTLSTAADEEEISKTENAKGHAYINIHSPAVAEALRCVVDYFPDLDLSGNIIKIFEPYSVFVFFEKELTEYRDRVAKAAQDKSSTCPNRWAAKHIGIVQAFVKDRTQEAVDAERARHARGYATFDMLWLLYRPGSDVYYDMYNYGEHEPYVVSRVHFNLVNGAADSYNLGLWNIDADSSWVGPFETQTQVERFTGEKRIPCLRAFPCEYLRFSDDIAEEEVSAIRQYYVNRGKRWYGLRQKTQCRQFDGFTTTFPRRDVSIAGGPRRKKTSLLTPEFSVCQSGHGGSNPVCAVARERTEGAGSRRATPIRSAQDLHLRNLPGGHLPARSEAQVLGLHQGQSSDCGESNRSSVFPV